MKNLLEVINIVLHKNFDSIIVNKIKKKDKIDIKSSKLKKSLNY